MNNGDLRKIIREYGINTIRSKSRKLSKNNKIEDNAAYQSIKRCTDTLKEGKYYKKRGIGGVMSNFNYFLDAFITFGYWGFASIYLILSMCNSFFFENRIFKDGYLNILISIAIVIIVFLLLIFNVVKFMDNLSYPSIYLKIKGQYFTIFNNRSDLTSNIEEYIFGIIKAQGKDFSCKHFLSEFNNILKEEMEKRDKVDIFLNFSLPILTIIVTVLCGYNFKFCFNGILQCKIALIFIIVYYLLLFVSKYNMRNKTYDFLLETNLVVESMIDKLKE